MAGDRQELIARFRAARGDRRLVVLEGLHAVKHALRFGAEIIEAVSSEPDAVKALAARLAPDILPQLDALVRPVEAKLFAELAPRPPDTGLLALARRPAPPPLPSTAAAPAVLLDRPAHLGNLGAVIRVAAAAEAAAVLVTGDCDPWHPHAVRASAGLHFALPVWHVDALPQSLGPIIGFDPTGEMFDPRRLPSGAVLAFGSERQGLSAPLRARIEHCVRLPMRPGVSSLNLATAVAAVLYLVGWLRQDQEASASPSQPSHCSARGASATTGRRLR